MENARWNKNELPRWSIPKRESVHKLARPHTKQKTPTGTRMSYLDCLYQRRHLYTTLALVCAFFGPSQNHPGTLLGIPCTCLGPVWEYPKTNLQGTKLPCSEESKKLKAQVAAGFQAKSSPTQDNLKGIKFLTHQRPKSCASCGRINLKIM